MTNQTTDTPPVQLLWTGGWDSTFRLLQLVLIQCRRVQPHYVFYTGRKSSPQELKTMDEIRHAIAQQSPAQALLIQPTQTVYIHEIRADPTITEKYKRLKTRAYLGHQYDWLTRYVDQYQLDSLELCIHVDDKAEFFVRDQVELQTTAEGDQYWQLKRNSEDPDLSLFAVYRFPLLKLTKVQMRAIAEQQGLLPLMEKTWFCHEPIGGQPCGLCNPCRFTIEEGLSYRLPLRARLRHRLRPVFSLAKATKRKARWSLRPAVRMLRAMTSGLHQN